MKKHLVLLIVGVLPGVILFLSTDESKASNAIETNTFYVAPNGSDSWSGRKHKPNADRTDGPFATLDAACAATRKADIKLPRRIVIGEGQYFLNKPLVLTDKDSKLTIEAATGANVSLYGGREITSWKKDGEKFYSAALPDVKEGKWDFRALVVNGRFCRRARLPEKGFFTHESTFNVPWMTSTGGGWKRKPTNEELTQLKYKPEDLDSRLDIKNAELTVYHMWDESMVGVSAMDTKSHTLTFSTPSGHPPGAFGVKKYVVWNVRKAMTKPGQWYLDRTAGKVVYWPLPGEDMSKAEVFAPTIESIILIKGTKNKPAGDITIRGLVLSVTTTPLKAGGFGAGRFAGAVSISSGRNCNLLDLEIVNVGGQGIKVSGSNLRIENCHVHHTGACGIKFSGAGSVVTNNHIHDVGLTYPSAIGLQGGGKDNEISHNEIHNTPYTAINWGGQKNRIEKNLIYRAMLELHDGGGIYCFAGKQLVLRGNFIRDIPDTGGYGSSAYYLDERSENCLVEGNLSINVARPTHNHMAKNNTIRNNVFICNKDARFTFPRSSDFVFERNIVYAKGTIVFDNTSAITTFKDNILYSTKGKVQHNKMSRYTRTGSEKLQPGDNMFAVPLLIGFENGKVKFDDKSPAVKLGIEPIDVSGAGRRP